MSFADAPSKDEAVRWSTQTLADYMRRLNLSSCDNVVLQRSMTGAQFMRSGDDQEYCEKKTEQENFICPVFELQRAEEQSSEKTGEKNDMTPAWEVPNNPPRSPRGQDCHRAKSSETPNPQSTRKQSTKISSKSPGKSTAYYSEIKRGNDRSKRPGKSGSSQRTFSQTKGSAAVALGSSVPLFIQQRAPPPTDVFNRSYPVPPLPSNPPKFNKPIPEPKKCLDPSWYGGNMTRHEAETALRAVNKDGAFIVRDSSKGSAGHPHTLMLLNQGKVYNIRIRRQGNSYLLGNGFNSTKSFPEVTEVITHHMNTPLVLIDATDQSSAEKPKCCLLHPAGL